MKRLSLTEYEQGGSIFRSYVAVGERRVWRQIDLWLTAGTPPRWIGFKATPVSHRAEGRYLARAGKVAEDPDEAPRLWRKRHAL